MHTFMVDYSKDFELPIVEDFKRLIVKNLYSILEPFRSSIEKYNGSVEILINNDKKLEITSWRIPKSLEDEIRSNLDQR